jgi:HAD superfamily hydrolase (TIGR01549 family)
LSQYGPDYTHITTVIFDMDGTLIEHTWQLEQISEVFFARFAEALEPITQEEFFDCFWAKSEDMWYMVVDGVLNGRVGARYAYINTLRSLGQEVDLAEAMLSYWVELVLREAVPFEDTFAVLEAVRQKYTTGILTNGFIELQRQKIERYNLAAYVDFTLVSEEAGYHKPDERLFLEALKLAGNVSPQETIYVGDSLVNDIKGALRAGLTPIFINSQDSLEPPEGVIRIQRLSELRSLLGL